MQRDIFLQMCQKVSVLKNGVCGIKENVPNDLQVSHKGEKYYPLAYEMAFNKGEVVHKAILHELNINAVKYVPLGEVEE